MSTPARALAVLLFGACAIGFAPILVRLSDTGPAAAAFWRFVFAAPLLLLLGRWTFRRLQADFAEEL